MSRRDRRRTNARRALFAGLALFLATQLAFLAALESLSPYHSDLDYRQRSTLLHERLREAPERPLCLLLGSSRTALSFCPEWLPPQDGSPEPLVFNFSHYGSGPILNLTLLRRLLADGVRPRWLVVELLPGYLVREREDFIAPHLAAGELRDACRYLEADKVAYWFVRTRIQTVPRFPLLGTESSGHATGPLGGCVRWLNRVTERDRATRTADAHRHFGPLLRQLPISPSADRAIHDLLALCRQEDIAVVLLLTPEGTVFRSWYGPGTEQHLTAYLRRLADETGTPIVDGRRWLPEEVFYDSHHVVRRGAEEFTQHLHTEVLQPLFAERLVNPRAETTLPEP